MASLYFDHNVSRDIGHRLRTLGHDVVLASDLQRENATDDEHLLVAANLARILITCNRKDFILLHDTWQRWSIAWRVSVHHSGILIIPGTWPYVRAAEELDAFVAGRSFMDELHDRTKFDRWIMRTPKRAES